MFYLRFLMIGSVLLFLSGLVMNELPKRADGFTPIDLLHLAEVK